MTEPTYLTVIELADRLRVQPQTIKTWAKQGRIPTIRVSPKTLRFDLAAVHAVLTTQSEEGSKAVTHGK